MLKQYVVDAFTDEVFKGNQAAICVMEKWLPDTLMQSIAIENNFSETAFTVSEGDGYRLRWFTPGGEIDLCGHATLATSWVLFHFYEKDAARIAFETRGGHLSVTRDGDRLAMDFPAYRLEPVPVTDEMAEAIGSRPLEAYMGRDLLCVMGTTDEVVSAKPDLSKVVKLPGTLLHITAKGDGSPYDCVSRSFAPKLAVSEDPVCGSGHCHIVPYWAGKLGAAKITARQASKRGGTLWCTMKDDRVELAGNAALYSAAELYI